MLQIIGGALRVKYVLTLRVTNQRNDLDLEMTQIGFVIHLVLPEFTLCALLATILGGVESLIKRLAVLS